jgi:hypothetical protein
LSDWRLESQASTVWSLAVSGEDTLSAVKFRLAADVCVKQVLTDPKASNKVWKLSRLKKIQKSL